MATGDVELVEHAARATAIVRGHVGTADIAAFLGGAFDEVVHVLATQHRHPAGPPFARYHPGADGFDVEAGFPADGPVEPAGRVVAGELPGGPVACALYRGRYDGVGDTYGAVERWLPDHGYAPAGEPWESYLDGPEVPEPRTLVSFPARAL